MISRDIIAYQNANNIFSYAITHANSSPMNLTSYTIKSEIRKHSSSSKYYSFTPTIVSANTGVLAISLSANSSYRIPEGRYAYDVIAIDSSNNYTRVVEGMITVKGASTSI